MPSYSRLPEHMQQGARDYVERGLPPGDFMMAVLRNDLVEAFGRADWINETHMKEWALWVYNDCPSAAWRTQEKIDAWIKKGGANGLYKSANERAN